MACRKNSVMAKKKKLDPKWLPVIEACVACGDNVEQVSKNLGLAAELVRPFVAAARRRARLDAARSATKKCTLTCLKCGERFESENRRANRLCQHCVAANAELQGAADMAKDSRPRHGGARD